MSGCQLWLCFTISISELFLAQVMGSHYIIMVGPCSPRFTKTRENIISELPARGTKFFIVNMIQCDYILMKSWTDCLRLLKNMFHNLLEQKIIKKEENV